jgi:hypothetical protein
MYTEAAHDNKEILPTQNASHHMQIYSGQEYTASSPPKAEQDKLSKTLHRSNTNTTNTDLQYLYKHAAVYYMKAQSTLLAVIQLQ